MPKRSRRSRSVERLRLWTSGIFATADEELEAARVRKEDTQPSQQPVVGVVEIGDDRGATTSPEAALSQQAPVVSEVPEPEPAAPSPVRDDEEQLWDLGNGVRDIAPVASALIDGDLGDVVVGLVSHGAASLFRDPQRVEADRSSTTASVQSLQAYLLVRGETLYATQHDTMPLIPFVSALLASPRVRKYIYNAQTLYRVIFSFVGTDRATINNVCDVSVGLPHALGSSHKDNQSLDVLARTHFQHYALEADQAGAVVAGSADAVRRDAGLVRHMGRRVDEAVLSGRQSKAIELDMRTEFLCAAMGFHGIVVDHNRWRDSIRALDEATEQLSERITSVTKAADASFSAVDAPIATLEAFLLDTLKLRDGLDESAKASLADGNGALEVLAAAGVAVASDILSAKALLAQRELIVQSFHRHAVPDSRGNVQQREADNGIRYLVHPHFTLRNAATGRIFTSKPNIQNLPKRSTTVGGVDLRSLYGAPPGCVLLSLDYNQIELRMLAHLSGDPALLAAFAAGGDVLRRIAGVVFKVPEGESATDTQREVTKIVVYGMIYGLGDAAMRRVMGESAASPAEVRSAVNEAFPHVNSFLDDVGSFAEHRMEANTLLGRTRRMAHEGSDRHRIRRMAIATAIQGSAAEVFKSAMWAIHEDRLVNRIPHAQVLSIHDEVVFAVPEGEENVKAIAARLGALMEAQGQVLGLTVPLTTTAKVGKTLGSLAALQ